MVKISNLTAVIITRNEEKKLPGCLASLDFIEQILVVDDRSEDATIQIAEKAGAKVLTRQLDNFAAQRNFAISKVKTEWTLMIDADERVPADMRREIIAAVARGEYDGYRFPRKNIIFGQWLAHAGWYPDYQLHLFKTKKARYVGEVHEQVEVKGKIGRLENALEHLNYDTVGQYLKKLDHYTTLSAGGLFASGTKFTTGDFIRRPAGEFLRRYFAEKGYAAGRHGLVLCLLQAFSELVVWLKLWELNRFPPGEFSVADFDSHSREIRRDSSFWLNTVKSAGSRFPVSLVYKLLAKWPR